MNQKRVKIGMSDEVLLEELQQRLGVGAVDITLPYGARMRAHASPLSAVDLTPFIQQFLR